MTRTRIAAAFSRNQPFTLPGAPLAAYSTRRIVAAYEGPLFQITRASDSTSIDIYPNAHGDAGLNAISSFGAGTTLVAGKWYDQSGQGNHLTLPSGAKAPQPLIMNGKVWLSFYNQRLATSGAIAANGDHTINIVLWQGATGDTPCFPISDYDGTNGWALITNASNTGKMDYYSTGSGFIYSTVPLATLSPARVTAVRGSGTVNVYVNGVQNVSGSGSNTASSSPLVIGGYDTSSVSVGLVSEAVVYASALSNDARIAIDTSQAAYWDALDCGTPYAGAAQIVTIGGSAWATLATGVLCYERTQPWTVWTAVQLLNNSAVPQIIFTNVPLPSNPNYPGYEAWIDSLTYANVLRIRLMNVVSANFIDVIGYTNLCDGRKHMIAVSYDGSSTAAGVKVYIDGTPEPTVVIADNLSASMVASGQQIMLGNQAGQAFGWSGLLGHFQIDAVVRSASYIAQYSGAGRLPPVDVNTAVSLAFTEGTGTTAHDASTNGNNGTLGNAYMWVP